MINRRRCLQGLGVVLGGSASLRRGLALGRSRQANDPAPPAAKLALADYQPKSMLQVPETRVDRAKYPVVDVHTHIPVSAKSEKGIDLGAERTYLARVLEKYRGRIDACAAHCGLSRRSISEKLRRYGIDKADFKPPAARRRSVALAESDRSS